MLSIVTNPSSIIAQRSLRESTLLLNQAIEQMTTGYQVNRAKDNAANFAIINNMTTKLSSYMVAEDNCATGLDMVTTANESLNLIYDKLYRLRDLAEQASNGTYGLLSLKAINSEANSMINEIDRIFRNVEFNGQKLFDVNNEGLSGTQAGNAGATADVGYIKSITRRNTDSLPTLESVNVATSLTSGTYSISTPEEIIKLATMTNNGLIGENVEFVLAKNIDFAGRSDFVPIGNDSNKFLATFDGNGYAIQNVKISTGGNYVGIFGVAEGNIKNLGIQNIEIASGNYCGGIIGGVIGNANAITVENCYVTGSINGTGNCGGIIGAAGRVYPIIDSCYVDTNIDTSGPAGGIIGGGIFYVVTINNCYIKGDISGEYTAGIAILQQLGGGAVTGVSGVTGKVTNSTFAGTLTSKDGSNPSALINSINGVSEVDTVTNCYFDRLKNPTAVVVETQGTSTVPLPSVATTGKTTDEIKNLKPLLFKYNTVVNGGGSSVSNIIGLQVGINADPASRINFDIAFYLPDLDAIRMLVIDSSTDFLTKLDEMLTTVIDKQTELGSIENRLESALTEIATQYENLVSSRSTLQDADIADVSSVYIQQQILQQASSSLLATANQAPSIALQLI